jgi:predicted amidohydrolase
VRIALGQLESGDDIQANLAAIDRFAAEAARDGAALVAFPEYATYEKKKVDATFPAVAEPLEGPSAGSSPPLPLAFYRKIHLFDAQGFGESTFIKPGPSTDPVVFEHGEVRFGLMTCYDLRFPELARSLADAGAQVLLVCSSWVPGIHKTEQWLALNAARAIEDSVYVAGVCQAPPVSVGRSVLVDPMGVVEADLGLEPCMQTVEVSLEIVERVRESFPMFRQRRL